jgi:hypothetical protein
MQGSIKTWTVVGALALALVFGGAFAFTSTAPWGGGLGGMIGPGMMGGSMMSGGMMGQGQGMGPGQMMGGCPGPWWSYGQQAHGPVESIDQAIEVAQDYLASLGNPDLVLTEIMQFTNNFYGEVEERSTGIGAFEFLIDPVSGAVYPEPGPNMMWNTKYGHMSGWGSMGGMMGGYAFGEPTAEMPVGPGQARQIAQQFLDNYLPRTIVDEEVDTFYGYYTIHVLQGGQIYGMLSVNGYTGQVWYHNWHGQFLGMRELEEH